MMKIKTQNGTIENIVEIVLTNTKITGTPAKDKRKRVFLGEYSSRERATEVYVEATELGWSEKNPVYVMPAE